MQKSPIPFEDDVITLLHYYSNEVNVWHWHYCCWSIVEKKIVKAVDGYFKDGFDEAPLSLKNKNK